MSCWRSNRSTDEPSGVVVGPGDQSISLSSESSACVAVGPSGGLLDQLDMTNGMEIGLANGPQTRLRLAATVATTAIIGQCLSAARPSNNFPLAFVVSVGVERREPAVLDQSFGQGCCGLPISNGTRSELADVPHSDRGFGPTVDEPVEQPFNKGRAVIRRWNYRLK